MATLKDIADQIGVSITTVSNAINGKGKVNPQTKNKILLLAAEYGYISMTDENAKKELKNIGVIFPEVLPGDETYKNYFVSEVLIGLEKEIKQRGYNLLLSSVSSDGGFKSISNLIEGGNIEALLIVGSIFKESFLVELKKHCKFPVIIVGTFSNEISIDAIHADNRLGAYQATKHLIGLGHTKIGFINTASASKTSAEKMAGYQDALYSHNLSFNQNLVQKGYFNIESGYHATLQLLKRERVTALFVADDLMAVGAIHAIHHLGFTVPGDISVVGFGNYPPGLYTTPKLTTVNIFKEKMGEIAVNQLFQIIGGGNTENLRTMLSTELIPRESTGICKT